MKMTLLLVAILISLVLAAAMPANASPQCGARDVVTTQLAEKYAETRRGIGIANNQSVMEVYASEAGSWTITVTLTDGRMCLVASGQAYETVTEVLPPQGIPG